MKRVVSRPHDQTVDEVDDHSMQPEKATLCAYCTRLTNKNPAAAQLEHWSTLGLLRPSSTKCAICKILLGKFDDTVKEAAERFKQITEAAAEQYPLSLNLIDDPNLESGVCYKFIEAGIALPNKFTYIWRFHIAARESQG